MIEVSVVSDVRAVTRQLRGIQRRAVPKATRAALNKTARSVRTEAKRTIAKELKVKAKVVDKRLGVFRASIQRLTAVIFGPLKERPINLIEWVRSGKRKVGAFRRKAGVQVNLAKSFTIPGSFIGTAKNSGKLLVFRRQAKARQPIEALAGPTVTQALRSNRILAKLAARAREVWPKEFQRAITRELAKIK